MCLFTLCGWAPSQNTALDTYRRQINKKRSFNFPGPLWQEKFFFVFFFTATKNQSTFRHVRDLRPSEAAESVVSDAEQPCDAMVEWGGELCENSGFFEITGGTVWAFSHTSFKAEHSLTLKDDFFARLLQGLHGLVVRGLAQVVTVDGQNGVADVKRFRLVGSQALEDLRDEDGHLVLLPTCWWNGTKWQWALPPWHPHVPDRQGRTATVILVY